MNFSHCKVLIFLSVFSLVSCSKDELASPPPSSGQVVEDTASATEPPKAEVMPAEEPLILKGKIPQLIIDIKKQKRLTNKISFPISREDYYELIRIYTDIGDLEPYIMFPGDLTGYRKDLLHSFGVIKEKIDSIVLDPDSQQVEQDTIDLKICELSNFYMDPKILVELFDIGCEYKSAFKYFIINEDVDALDKLPFSLLTKFVNEEYYPNEFKHIFHSGLIKIVEYLEKKGFDLYNPEWPVVAYAIGFSGNMELMKHAISHGGNIAARDSLAVTAAAKTREPEYLTYLFEHGAELPVNSETIFKELMYIKDYEFYQSFLDKVPRPFPGYFDNVLATAAKDGKMEFLKLLIKNGVDASNNRMVMTTAVRNNDMALLDILVENGAKMFTDDFNLLIVVIEHLKFNMIKKVASLAPDPAEAIKQAVLYTIKIDFVVAFSYIVEKGIFDFNENPSFLYKPLLESRGDAILRYLFETNFELFGNNFEFINLAIEQKKYGIVRDLVERYSRAREYVSRQFVKACAEGDEKLMDLYLDLFRVDVRFDHDAAIRIASKHGHYLVVEKLIKRKAYPRAMWNEPIRNAFENGNTEVVVLLVENGADINAITEKMIDQALANGFGDMVETLRSQGL